MADGTCMTKNFFGIFFFFYRKPNEVVRIQTEASVLISEQNVSVKTNELETFSMNVMVNRGPLSPICGTAFYVKGMCSFFCIPDLVKTNDS
jgi:hypothetical protein